MATASSILETAPQAVRNAGGLTAFIREVGFGSIAYAIILQLVEGINSAGTLILGPVRALGRGMIVLTDTIIGGVLGVFDAGTQTTIQSFLDGSAALLGPLAQPASVGVVMLTLFVFLYSINRLSITPLAYLQSLRR